MKNALESIQTVLDLASEVYAVLILSVPRILQQNQRNATLLPAPQALSVPAEAA